jgi:predicted transcriptional regulator
MLDTGSEKLHVPEINLFQAAQALQNKIRQQIFFLLTNRNNLSFNELKQNLNVTQPKLAYHLQVLINNNIIINFYDKRKGVKDHSFYELSAFSKELITGIFVQPQQMSPSDKVENSKDENFGTSSNFRTIQQINYKSYKNTYLKRTSKSLEPVKKEDINYIEPMLGYNIINKPKIEKDTKMITLPSFRKYYLTYKHSFKSDHKIPLKESK